MTERATETVLPESNSAEPIATKLLEAAMPGKPGNRQGGEEQAQEQNHSSLSPEEIGTPADCSQVLKGAARPRSLEELQDKSEAQLSCIYRESHEGKMPDGNTDGRAIFMPGNPLGTGLSDIADSIWKGKVFDMHGGLVNKILGQDIVHAKVFSGKSWLDGKPATIIDYKNTSLIAGWIRDEIREVNPGLYLGIAYGRLPFGQHYPALFFALDDHKKK